MKNILIFVLSMLIGSTAFGQLCGTNGPPNDYTVCRSTPTWGGLPVGLPVVGLNGGVSFLPSWYDDPSIVNKQEIGGCNGVDDPNCLGRVERLGWPYWERFFPTETWCQTPPGASSEYDCWADAIDPLSGYMDSNGVFRYNGDFAFTKPVPGSGDTTSLHIAGWIDVSDNQSGMHDYILSLRPYFSYTYVVNFVYPSGETESLFSSERIYFDNANVNGSFEWLAVERFNSGTFPKGKHERWYFEGSIVVPDDFTPPSCSNFDYCVGTEFNDIFSFGMEWQGEYRHNFHRASGNVSWIMRAYAEEEQPLPAVICQPTDLNCDGSVNGLDMAVITRADNWLKRTNRATDDAADLNKDGSINGLDLSIIARPSNWLHSTGPCTCN